MSLEAVEVKNFKSIRNSGRIDVDDLNILVGKNDAGKSSILQAVKIFLDEDKPNDDQFHKDCDDDVEISVTFSHITDELSNALDEKYTADSEFTVTREFYSRGASNPGANTYVNGEKLSSGAVRIDGGLTAAKSRNYIWNFFPSVIFVEAERDVAEATKLKRGTRLNQLLVPILEQGGVGDKESIIDTKKSLESSLEQTSNRIGERLTNNIQNHLTDIEEIKIDHGEVDLAKAISPSVELKDRYLPDSVDISERGSGVGSLFILSLMQAYVDTQVGEDYCILFEEPGNWLHPSAERKMLDALRGISNEGGQIILTSHSEVFIDRTQEGQLYLVKRQDGESRLEKITEDAFRAVEEIGARNSDLLQSDFVLYVEGYTDVRIVEEVCRQAFENWDSRNAVIQHLGGTGNIEHCDPADLKKINRSCAFLLDSDRKSEDDSPNPKAQEMKEDAEQEDVPCKILHKREIENYFSSAGINSRFGLNTDSKFIPDYGDAIEKINTRISQEHAPEGQTATSYDKTKHGYQIVRAMYENGERIEEIEEFVKDCLPAQSS